jgi:hypothetical protein
MMACASSVAAATAVSADAALAFDIDGQADLITETVASKKPETREPEAPRIGNFLVFPEIGTRAVYDDNIFSAPNGEVSDFRLETTPSLRFMSRLPRHELDLSLSGKIVTYEENTDQNYENVLGKVRGALHFDHAHTLSAVLSSALDHEEVGESTAPVSAAEPVGVVKNRAAIGLTRDVGRLYGTIAATAETSDFQDVRATDGSILDQDIRNQTIYGAQIRTGYRFSPGYEWVTKFRAVHQENEPDALGTNNVQGYEAMTGLAFESSQVLSWRLIGGYGIRDFERAGIDSIGSYLVEGQVHWLPMERLRLAGSIRREIIDTVGADDNGRVDSSILGRMEYEIRHDLAFKLGAELTDTEYLGSPRTDLSARVNASLEYELARNWQLTLGYQYLYRDSNFDQFDNERNRFSIGAKLRF